MAVGGAVVIADSTYLDFSPETSAVYSQHLVRGFWFTTILTHDGGLSRSRRCGGVVVRGLREVGGTIWLVSVRCAPSPR
jgi:hypothetical protein